MKMTISTTEVLGNEKWSAIEQGLIYWTPGKIMIVQGNEQAIILDYMEEKMNLNGEADENLFSNEVGDLEQAIRDAIQPKERKVKQPKKRIVGFEELERFFDRVDEETENCNKARD